MANYQLMRQRGLKEAARKEADEKQAAKKSGAADSSKLFTQYPKNSHNTMTTEEVQQGHRYGNYWN